MRRDGFDHIYPSHSEEKVSRDVIPLLIEGAEKIVSGAIPAEQKEVFGKVISYYDVGVSRFLCEPVS